MPRVAIALGSNVGDRRAHLTWAVDRLHGALTNLRVSSFIDTDPVGVPSPQASYLNAVAIGDADRTPRDLLTFLSALERERGRTRAFRNAPRTLDLDLILYGDDRIDEAPDLIVPHPRFRERRFVLAPLAELAADWEDPVTGRSVGELLADLS